MLLNRTARSRASRTMTILVVVLALILLQPSPAFATASSALTQLTGVTRNNGVSWICGRATIKDVADNVSNTYSYSNINCTGARSVTAGSLGAKANGYRSGSYCGTTGWAYNSGTTSGFAVGSHLCSNPSGSQAFRTTSYSAGFSDPLGYYLTGSVNSPNQNY